MKKAVPLIAAMILSDVCIAKAEEGFGCLNPHFPDVLHKSQATRYNSGA
jgi:hypothetical protein